MKRSGKKMVDKDLNLIQKVMRMSPHEKMQQILRSCQNGLNSTKAQRPREFLSKLKLDRFKIGIGYNSGQYFHGKPLEVKQAYEDIDVLRESGTNARNPKEPSFKVFGKDCLIFSLEDEKGHVVNLYALKVGKFEGGDYLNKNGVFPHYPPTNTKRVYITDTILDAATLIQSNTLDNREAVIALHDGIFTDQHCEALSQVEGLKEIIQIRLREDSENTTEEIQGNSPVQMKVLYMKQGRSLHDVFLEGGADAVEQLTCPDNPNMQLVHEGSLDEIPEPIFQALSHDRFIYWYETGSFEILGELPDKLEDLTVHLHFVAVGEEVKYRVKIDLYNSKAVETYITEIGERYDLDLSLFRIELERLIYEIEKYRNKANEPNSSLVEKTNNNPELAPKEKEVAMDILQVPDPIQEINRLLGNSGIVREFNTRMLLFLIAISYKLSRPLHAIVQSGSGSGKSHLINSIGNAIPSNDIINITRATSKSFYHYGPGELIDKVMLIQDFSGLDEEGMFALREMQTNGSVSSVLSQKDQAGNQKSVHKVVNAKFSSIGATTRPELYMDNMNRSIIVSIDEGADQTDAIIEYKNKKKAGKIDVKQEEDAKRKLRNITRLIHAKEVINPYADQIQLPVEAKTRRRLNDHFLSLVDVVTLVNQHQRTEDQDKRLITEKEDIQIALEIFFEAVMLNISELDGSTNQFFEELTSYLKKCSKARFTMREVRNALHRGKTQSQHYVNVLLDHGYLQREGSRNRGYTYQMVVWQRDHGLRKRIKNDLHRQIKNLPEYDRTPSERQRA